MAGQRGIGLVGGVAFRWTSRSLGEVGMYINGEGGYGWWLHLALWIGLRFVLGSREWIGIRTALRLDETEVAAATVFSERSMEWSRTGSLLRTSPVSCEQDSSP